MTEAPPLGSIPPLAETVLELLPIHEQDFWTYSEIMPPKGFVVDIKDPLWGNLRITPPASYLFTAPAFIRTANVKQLSTTRFLFNGATHSRLGHQIGVYYLMTKIYDQLVKDGNFRQKVKTAVENRIYEEWKHILDNYSEDKESKSKEILAKYLEDGQYNIIYDVIVGKIGRELIGISGLLHDIGHGGWGHVFDALNGLIFRMLQIAQSQGAFGTSGFLTQSLLEIQKLDITSATYVITSSEQIRLLIRAGFDELIERIQNNQNNNLIRKISIIIKELNDGFHLLDIIITIISEDITIPKLNGRLHNKALSWYQRTDTDIPDNLILFAIISEILYIISQIGIQLLGDLSLPESPCHETNSTVAGINSDRLDWIPRDVYHIGHLEDFQENIDSLREHIKKLIQRPLDFIHIQYDDSNKLILLCHRENMQKLHHLVREIRERLYKIYHDPQKALYDSVLVRAGYSSINLIRSVAETIFTRDLSLRLAISYLLNNDESFINDSIKILRSAIGSPASHLLVRTSTIDESLFNGITSNDILNKIKTIYDNFKNNCNTNCKNLLNMSYTIKTASPIFTRLLNQSFLLTQIINHDNHFYITSHYPGSYNDKNAIYTKILRLKDLLDKYNKFNINNYLKDFISILNSSEKCELFNITLKEMFRDFSEDLITLNIPLIEHIVNYLIQKQYPYITNIYISYIHYTFRNLIRRLDYCGNANEGWLNDIFSLPLFVIFIQSLSHINNNERSKIESDITTIISYMLITMLIERAENLDII